MVSLIALGGFNGLCYEMYGLQLTVQLDGRDKEWKIVHRRENEAR